jgi:hypothetical protein
MDISINKKRLISQLEPFERPRILVVFDKKINGVNFVQIQHSLYHWKAIEA